MISYNSENNMVADAVLPAPPDPSMDFTKPAKPSAGKPVAAKPPVSKPSVAAAGAAMASGSMAPALPPPPAPVPAATTPAQMPIPTKQQLGGSDKPPPDYSTMMDAVRGPLPSTQQITDGWKTPEAQAAAKQFHSAIMANFYLASADANSLNMFFQSNPYAYMLGQSVDNISKIMAEKSRKESGDDPLIGQLAPPSVIFDTAAMMQGRDNLAIGMPYGASESEQKYHAQVLSPWLDNLNKSGYNRVVRYIMDSAFGLNKEHPQLISAYANDKGARASLMNAQANKDKVDLDKHMYETTGKAKDEAEIAQVNANTQVLTANAYKLREEAGLVRSSGEADIRYKNALAEASQASIGNDQDRLALDGLKVNEMHDQTAIEAQARVMEGYFQQSQTVQQTITEYTKNGGGRKPATQADVDAAAKKDPPQAVALGQMIPDAHLQELIDTKEKYDGLYQQSVLDMEKMRDHIRQNSESASPTYQARTMSIWLSKAAKNDYDTTKVALDALNESNSFVKSQYFPSVPMAWNPAKNEFTIYTGIKANEALTKDQMAVLYRYMYTDPDTLASIRNGKYMSIQQFMAWAQSYNSKNQELPGFKKITPIEYRHFVVMCNYVKQVDHLIQQYHLAKNASISFGSYVQQHDEEVDAPQIDPSKVATSLPPAPRPTKGRSK